MAPSGPKQNPLLLFRRLALASVVSTFVLVLVGGIVRMTDSGLGCGPAGSGLEGWPLCGGSVVPGLDTNAVIEFTHRALASAVGLLMIALAVIAWRRLRSHRGIVRASIGAAVLVVLQGLLGAATVEWNLDAELVAAHLLLAMLLLALVIYLWRSSTADPDADAAPPTSASGGALRGLAVAAATATLLTIVAGGYMAGTEHQGRPDEAQTFGAHYACGTQFPLCNGELLPFGSGRLVDIHLTHRAFMYLTVVLVLATAALALVRRPSRGTTLLASASLLVLLAQVLVGALNVWLAPTQGSLVVLHLGLGTLLWSVLVGLRLSLSPASAPAPELSRSHPRAVTA